MQLRWLNGHYLIIIPKIPSIKVTDLAKAVAPKLPNKIVGIRNGEKIHEELISLAESNDTYDVNKYYLILNSNKKLINHYKKKFKAKKIKKNFSYNSKDNSKFLKVSEIQQLIKIHQNIL